MFSARDTTGQGLSQELLGVHSSLLSLFIALVSLTLRGGLLRPLCWPWGLPPVSSTPSDLSVSLSLSQSLSLSLPFLRLGFEFRALHLQSRHSTLCLQLPGKISNILFGEGISKGGSKLFLP
jgi:hypothetical protein